MDRQRFDALARLLATTGSRRATLGAFLGVGLLGHDPDVLAKRGKGKGKGHGGQSVQGEKRPGAKHKAHHQHKHTQRQRRQKRDRHDRRNRDGGQNREPSSAVCCGATTPCAPPEPGSSRAHCDFAGQAFTGQDLHGTDFRQIEGAGATFDDTDLHGARFVAACLRRASFRGANLAGTSWDGSCLFAADFTEADLGGDPAALDEAVLCATILPDGTRSDRDCDRSASFPCCLPPAGGGGGGGCTPDGFNCYANSECCSGQCLDKGFGSSYCGLCTPDFHACTAHSECCSQECTNGSCGGSRCERDQDCPSPKVCCRGKFISFCMFLCGDGQCHNYSCT